jgi:Zn-dependent peptidase ImmA (M78 family)
MRDLQEIGGRLTLARTQARLSTGLVAKAAGVTEAELAACEAGQGLTAGRLAALAGVYGLAEEDLAGEDALPQTAVGVLLRGDPHPEELALHIGRLASICREQTVLEDLLGAPARGHVADFSPAGDPSPPAHKQGEELADKVRDVLQLGLAPIRSMTSLLADLGIRLVWTDSLGEEIQGLTLHDARIGPSIIANIRGRKNQWWTLRSTLAHELCHVLFDRVPASPIGIASRRDQRESVEQRANAFGVYFLAPRRGVARLLMDRGCRPFELDHNDVHAVMSQFGLGKDAVTWHLKHLDWITEDQRQDLLGRPYPTEPQADNESPEAQPLLGPFIELGVHLERLALVAQATTAWSRGLITEGRLRESLGLDPFTNLGGVLAG